MIIMKRTLLAAQVVAQIGGNCWNEAVFGSVGLPVSSPANPDLNGRAQRHAYECRLLPTPAFLLSRSQDFRCLASSLSPRPSFCTIERPLVACSRTAPGVSFCHRPNRSGRCLQVRMPNGLAVMRMKGTKNRAFYEDEDEDGLVWAQRGETRWPASGTDMMAPGSFDDESVFAEQAFVEMNDAGLPTEDARDDTLGAEDSQATFENPPEAMPNKSLGSAPQALPDGVNSQPRAISNGMSSESQSVTVWNHDENNLNDSDDYLGPFVDPSASYLQCPECAMCYEIEASLLETARICRCTVCLHEFMASAADLISADTLVSDRPTMGARPLPRAEALARAEARLRPVRNVIAEALASEARDATGTGENSLPSATEYADIMLFVGNLAPAVSESDLVAAFAPYGDLLSCRIIRDRQRGHSLGYGFVRFTSKEDARLALDQLRGTCIMGQDISIGYARGTGPREPEEDHHVPARRSRQFQPRYDPQNRLGVNSQDSEESDDAENRYRSVGFTSSFRPRSDPPLRRSFRRGRSMNRYPGTSAPGHENRVDQSRQVENEDE